MYVVESRLDADLLEHGHAEDGEDEHDEQEEEGDVDEGGQGHHQREDQRPDPLGRLDEAQDAADLHHAHLQSGKRWIVLQGGAETRKIWKPKG